MIFRQAIKQTNTNYSKPFFDNLTSNQNYLRYALEKQVLFKDLFNVYSDRRIVDALLSKQDTFSRLRHVAFHPKSDQVSPGVNAQDCLFYYTSLDPKAAKFDSIGIFPGVISDDLLLNQRSKPSNLVLKYGDQGFDKDISYHGSSIFSYPFEYRLVNNFYYNPYVETLSGKNTLLFDINKTCNINHYDILRLVNPRSPRYNLYEIIDLPLNDFLLYEAKLESKLFIDYARLNARVGTSDISALYEAIELITNLPHII